MVDFFSIGTNDLTQYTFAADRMNQKVSQVIDACNVSILRMIRFVSEAAHKNGIWVGVCGESASDPNFVPHFIAMEIDELSMSPPAIMKTKEQILGLCKDDCIYACNELLR
jgi:phosphotransferase system enzyme I (PtsI)